MKPPLKHQPVCLLLAALAAATLASCGDSEEEREERASQFTTSAKPAPNPQFEALSSFIRNDRAPLDDQPGQRSFPLYSEYAGEDIRQVTGVSGRSLLLCFTAPWCPHCTRMKKALQELAQSEKGTLQVVVVNADDYPVLAEEYKLSRVPTTVLYTEGVKLRTIFGAYSAKSLTNYLRNVLSQTEGDVSP